MPCRGLGAVAADLRVPNGDLLPAVVAIGHMVIAGPALLPFPKKSGIAFAVPGFFVSVRNDLAMKCGRRLDGAPLGVQAVEQGRFQFLVQRQHRRPEPPAQ